MSINTIIVDDEKPARDELAFLLKGFPEINVIGQGKNGVEAVSLIKEHAPDLVFLDVKMPGLDGFGVLKKIVERKMKMPHVVFATAFDQYAVQAFDVNAVDYVLKPFDKARIAKAIARARKMLETQTSATERLELAYGVFPVLRTYMARKGPEMSGGERKMLSIARALALDPQMLLLDEPFEGLSPAIIPAVSDGIAQITRLGHAVLLAESNIHHVPEYTTRLYVIERGEIVFAGTPDDAWRDTTVLRIIGGTR